ncbi:hypothetical protein, partial [Endozoicomonas sp. YOMI1]|uniref:hypothetical protein n=1 Tax=Endozoicomonas sp. YOMI1 TaxID=2828739 RepID=UPI00214750CD
MSVIVRSAVIPFFQSLSPHYQQPAANNNESVSYDSRPVALPSQLMLNDICQGAGLVAQLAGAWVPQVEALADVASKLCFAGSFGGKAIEYMQQKWSIREAGRLHLVYDSLYFVLLMIASVVDRIFPDNPDRNSGRIL